MQAELEINSFFSLRLRRLGHLASLPLKLFDQSKFKPLNLKVKSTRRTCVDGSARALKPGKHRQGALKTPRVLSGNERGNSHPG